MKTLGAAVTILISLASAGCSTATYTLSAHTVEVAADRETDVVWVARGGHILRCSGRGDRPTCERVE